MSKKAREKPAEAGSASVSPYGSVLGYELVTSQPNRLINLIWPECRTWFIGPCFCCTQYSSIKMDVLLFCPSFHSFSTFIEKFILL